MKYKELENLCDKNLITFEQRDAIAEALKIGPFSKARNYLFVCACALGGILVLAGIIMLISANWEDVPARVKQIGSSILLLGFWLAGLKFFFQKNPRPIVGEIFCSLGAVMLLVCIALYGQIYQLSSETWKPLFAWFVGIVAFPWILKLRGVFVISLIAGTMTILTYADENFNGSNAFFITYATFISIFALGVFLKNCLGEKARSYAVFPRVGGFLCATMMAFFACFSVVNFKMSALLVFAGTLVFLVAQIWNVFCSSENNRRFGIFVAGTQALFFVFPLIASAICFGNNISEIYFGDNNVFEILMIALFFVTGVLTMIWGAKINEKFHINTGTFLVLLSGLAVLTRVIESLSTSGFVLIFAGTFFLAFAYLLVRSRKILTEKVANENISVPAEKPTENQ